MSDRVFARGSVRKSLAMLMCLALALGAAPGVFAQDPTATIAGVILDPSGRPAFGFKAILIDVGSDIQYMSAPTDAAGNYTVKVPVGGRYKLTSVVANDGVTKLAVQDIAPVSVLTAGTTRLNIRFTGAPAAVTETATTDEEEKKKKKGAVPWYKRPGPIVGLVLGSVAVAAILLDGNSSNDNTASQYKP